MRFWKPHFFVRFQSLVVVEAGGELCIVVKWLDAPAAGTTNKRKIVGETQSLTLEQWKGDYKARRA